MKNTLDDRYTSGEYLEKNPTFHIERADFKAGLVSGILKKNSVGNGGKQECKYPKVFAYFDVFFIIFNKYN